MKVKYYLKNVPGLITPVRANQTDAGYDITAVSEPKIVGASSDFGWWSRIDYIEYHTNLYFVPDTSWNWAAPSETTTYVQQTPVKFHTDIQPRSSISARTNLVLGNSFALIDRGYHNEVLLRFKYIWQPEDFTIVTGMASPNMDRVYKKGEKIAQLLPRETHDIEFELVDDLSGEDRGGGFGSTDKKQI